MEILDAPVTTISKKEFAQLLGVTAPAVSRALKSGRITSVWVGGKERIDPVEATRQWREYSRPYRRSVEKPAPLPAPPPPPDVEPEGADMTLHDARTKRERHEAGIAEMKEKQLAGSLVDRERVRAAALRSGRLLRDTVLGVPTRIAHDLLGLTDPWEAQRRLEEALRQALEDAAKIHKSDLEGVLADGR